MCLSSLELFELEVLRIKMTDSEENPEIVANDVSLRIRDETGKTVDLSYDQASLN